MRLRHSAGTGHFVLLVAVSIFAGPPADSRERSLSARDFFRAARIQNVALSPRGDMYLSIGTDRGVTAIRVDELEGPLGADIHRYAASDDPVIHALLWTGPSTFLASVEDKPVEHFFEVVREGGTLELERLEIVQAGRLVWPEVDDPDYVLWSPYFDARSIYRVTIEQLTTPGLEPKAVFGPANRVTRMKEPVDWFACDEEGTPRLAFVTEPGRLTDYWVTEGDSGRWKRLSMPPASLYLLRVAIGLGEGSADVLLASNELSGRLAIYRHGSQPDGQLVEVQAHPDFDVHSVVFDSHTGVVIGGVHLEAGRPVLSMFGASDQAMWATVVSRFPEQIVVPISWSADRSIVAVWVAGPSDPGRVVAVGSDGGVVELGELAPWLPPAKMARVQTFQIDRPGVGKIEAYLWLPPTSEPRPPVVVYPHGGPLDVRDVTLFDPAIHYIANAGYAVLQVNYRGSGGFGVEFVKAGVRQWGRGIEDDVDAALERAWELELVDPYRVCVMGASYGGYSALMSVVRHPERFRCAISTAGVSDIPLVIRPDMTEEVRAAMTEIAGDPQEHYEEMKRHSPVYRVAEIRTPILLVHGAVDHVVDVEHSYRMQAMLELHGRESHLEVLPGLGHSGWSRREMRSYYKGVVDFLRFHLE